MRMKNKMKTNALKMPSVFYKMTQELCPQSIIRVGDFLELSPGEWGMIRGGSIFVGQMMGQAPPNMKFRRKKVFFDV